MIWGLAARCGPLSLLAASLVFIPGALAIRDPRVAGLAVGAVIVLLALVVGGQAVPLLRLLPAAIAFVSVTWSNWLLSVDRSVPDALTVGGRVVFFVLPGVVLASFLDPSSVGDHLGQRLRLPARPVLALVAALQRLESLGEDWAELSRVRRARGLGPSRGPVSRVRFLASTTFGLLVHAIRQAGRMTVAMEARGYSAPHADGRRRTWAEPAPWRPADTALVLMATAIASLPMLL